MFHYSYDLFININIEHDGNKTTCIEYETAVGFNQLILSCRSLIVVVDLLLLFYLSSLTCL